MELLSETNKKSWPNNSRPTSLGLKSVLSESSTPDEVIEYMTQLKQRLQHKNNRLSRETISRNSIELSREQIETLVSMLPDEVIQNPTNFDIRKFEAAVVSVDVSGFTDLSENYQKVENGASKLSIVLNFYLGTMAVSIGTSRTASHSEFFTFLD